MEIQSNWPNISPHPSPISLIKKASGFFGYCCSITFSETIIILQDNYLHWANFTGTFSAEKLKGRIQIKPCLLISHFRNQSKFSPKNPRGKGWGVRKRKNRKAFWSYTIEINQKSFIYTRSIIILTKRARQYLSHDGQLSLKAVIGEAFKSHRV